MLRTFVFISLISLLLTRGMVMAEEKKTLTNRLSNEKSPYLLQHADNPVDWFPWGEEAFQKAKKENRPLFVSIGYSTCHWCHVMEKESFSNVEIATILNEHFVSIKVDREERPDIDSVYMKAVMAMTGSGGWPLNVFLTPDKIPFYGGTYFPPQDKWGRPGFKTLLLSIAKSWREQRQEIIRSGADIAHAIKQQNTLQSKKTSLLNETTLSKAYSNFYRQYDSHYGGFGAAPKFPQAHVVGFLLRHWSRTQDQQVLRIIERTLIEMASGGIYDQLGGGFHRYSTDAQWRIPHFEKMLYDQALLSKIYLEAFQATKKKEYATIARGILDYVAAEMMHSEGGFYSAQDADSIDPLHSNEKKEGAYYLWRRDEIIDILGKEIGEVFNYCFGVTSTSNAISDPHGEFKGKNVLYIAHSIQEAAQHFNKSVTEIERIIRTSKKKLSKERRRRPRPHLDDKILTDWNGLMISSFAFASRVLDDASYRHVAEKAAQFILKRLVDEKGYLFHRYREGEAAYIGTIEDYSFFIHGLIDLYEATFDAQYLKEAVRLAHQMVALFWDETSGGFFFTADNAEELFMREKEIYDGAIPSGNSVAALDLIRLGRLTTEEEFEKKAEKLLEFFSSTIVSMPNAYPQSLIALDYALGPSKEIVISQGKNRDFVDDCIRLIYDRFIPRKVVVFRPRQKKNTQEIVNLVPFIDGMTPQNDRTAIYVCEDYVCKMPIMDQDNLITLLDAQ